MDLTLTKEEELLRNVKIRRQAWLQQSRDGGGQDPERREQGKKQDHNPGLQQSRVWPVQRAAEKNCMGYSPGGKRGPAELFLFKGLL